MFGRIFSRSGSSSGATSLPSTPASTPPRPWTARNKMRAVSKTSVDTLPRPGSLTASSARSLGSARTASTGVGSVSGIGQASGNNQVSRFNQVRHHHIDGESNADDSNSETGSVAPYSSPQSNDVRAQLNQLSQGHAEPAVAPDGEDLDDTSSEISSDAPYSSPQSNDVRPQFNELSQKRTEPASPPSGAANGENLGMPNPLPSSSARSSSNASANASASPDSPPAPRRSASSSQLWTSIREKALNAWSKLDLIHSKKTANAPVKKGVEVNFRENGTDVPQKVDAVRLTINEPTAPENHGKTPVTRNYLCGRTDPQALPEAVSKHDQFFVQGIMSGQGVYEFVSRRTHHQPEKSSAVAIIDSLRKRWHEQNSLGKELVVGGRFRIVGITPEHADAPLPRGATPTVADMHRHCQVRVIDLEKPNSEPVDIRVTQVGLKYEQQYFSAPQIEQSYRILQEHLQHRGRPNASPGMAAQALPMIASASGIGRAPTLITYSEVRRQIDAGLVVDEATLEAALSDVVSEGRRARISDDVENKRVPDLTGFVHSEQQLQELKVALQNYLATKTTASVAQPASESKS